MSLCHSPLLTPNELQQKFPLNPDQEELLRDFRKMGQDILSGNTQKFVAIVGPCSIHDPAVAIEYAKRLQSLQEKVSDHIFLVMRVFVEKPRSQFGWKGFVYDPLLDGSHTIDVGLSRTRELLIELTNMEIPIATEFLDPLLIPYYSELITWGMIGARTTASQVHRQMASQLSIPIGFKNETDGTIDNAIAGALAARMPQALLGIDGEGKVAIIHSQGNPNTHLVLRGGTLFPNYDPISISETIQKKRLAGLYSPIIIDCAHGNSQRDAEKQKEVFYSVLEQIEQGNNLIMGTMIESHLEGGNAVSFTDPCLDWESTESMLLDAYNALKPCHV